MMGFYIPDNFRIFEFTFLKNEQTRVETCKQMNKPILTDFKFLKQAFSD